MVVHIRQVAFCKVLWNTVFNASLFNQFILYQTIFHLMLNYTVVLGI
jgi:hypothetical protein